MSFFNRRVEMRKLMYVLVTQADIEELFDLPNPIITIPSIRMEGIIRRQHWTGFFPVVRLGDFENWMGREGRETHCAVVRVKPTEARTLRPYAGPGFTAAEPLLDVEVAGAALFRKDKLVGFLTQKETRGLLWVLGEVRGGPLLVRCPEGDKFTSLRILRAQSRVTPEITADGRLRVTIRIREEADLEETECKLDVGEAGAIAELEALQAQVITAEVMSAVRKAQEYRSDAFGFGEAFHRRYPREWRLMKERWSEDFFPAVEVKVAVDAKIRRVGLRKKPLTLTPKLLD
jgi:spore germination protein KC